jgi:hypothetical protein
MSNFKLDNPITQVIGGAPGILPGSVIQPGTITNTQLSLGSAADNINAGPGLINSSQAEIYHL